MNKEKYLEILHYVIHKCGHLENIGKTTLYKMLYFIDFDFYELNEKKLIGECYTKMKYGPVPCNFDAMIRILKRENKVIGLKMKFGIYPQQKFLCIKEPNLKFLDGNEKSHIDKEIMRLSSMNATQISAFSHEDMPWKATEMKKPINYNLVFYRDPLFSVREYSNNEL